MNAPLPKSRLGRGLASLIGEPVQGQASLPPEGEQRLVPTAELRAGRLNPRKDFRDEELAELAESIRSKGLVQPIIVRPVAGGYEIVAGERRWRAAQKAGLHTVPVIARDLNDKEVLELAIIENVQRADLNAIEEATGYRDLVERFSYSQEQLSEIIGKSRSHVANTLRLLKLPETVQAMVQDGRLTAGHARALIGRADAETLARRILDESLNVRQVEALVQDGGAANTETTGGTRNPRDKDADTRAFENELSSLLGLKVEIKRGSGESGNLVIRFGNFDQLDYIRMRLVHGASS
jgi:ParB family transcriptional regulator, chromosome partitioning protein